MSRFSVLEKSVYVRSVDFCNNICIVDKNIVQTKKTKNMVKLTKTVKRATLKKTGDSVCLVFYFDGEKDFWFVDLRNGFHFKVLNAFLEYVYDLEYFVGMELTIEQEVPEKYGGTVSFVLGSPETNDSHRISIDVDYLVEQQKNRLENIKKAVETMNDSIEQQRSHLEKIAEAAETMESLPELLPELFSPVF